MVGLTWRKCALHIHTPCSHDVEDNEYTAKDLLDLVGEKGIEVIGITDHNNCEFIDEIIKENKKNQNPLIIFPGVEITSSDGIHFLVYFDIKQEDLLLNDWDISKTTEYIREFLSELGIHRSSYFNNETKAKYSILGNFKDIQQTVKKFEGFLLFAHVKTNDNGLLRKGSSTDFVTKELKDLYIPFECKREKIDEILGIYPNRALILNTDFHHLDEYDTFSPTFIKFGDNPTIDSLNQIMFDPKLRICYELTEVRHPHITQVLLNTKYFKSMTISFNPYLNVIIGGRGSGKSVVIEIITYLLSKYFDLGNLHNLVEYCKKMDELFEENDKMILDFFYEHQNYRLQRFFSKFQILKSYEKDDKKMTDHLKKYESNNSTTLFQFIDNNWQEIDINTILPLINPHLFTQTAVASIPKQGGQLLQIVEDFSGLSSLRAQYLRNKNALSELMCKIQDLENELEILYKKISEPEEFNHEIQEKKNKIEEYGSSISNIELKNKQKIDVIRKRIEIFMESLNRLAIDEPRIEKVQIDYEAFKTFQEKIYGQIDAINELGKTIFLDIEKYNVLIKNLKQSLELEWRDLVKKEEKRIRETGINWHDDESQINQLITDLKTELTKINAKKIKNAENIRKIHNLETKRTELIEKIDKNSIEVMDFLNEICNKVQSRIKIKDVSLKSIPKEDELIIRMVLNEILKGISGKDGKIEKIINSFSTKDIFSLIVDQDEGINENLKEILSPKVIDRFSKYFDNKFKDLKIDEIPSPLKGINNKNLLVMERAPVNSNIEYKLKKGNDWKELKNLSPGERCALLIALILIEHSNMIIIDQPEDELDYKSRRELVDMIKEKKNTSQIIMITHYQNIPVLADAEIIILMDEIDNHGVISKQGCFEVMRDELINMEGGPEAIRIRFEKYKI